ncbi:hypothetical protein MMC09_000908 [Bachmanniomyces sp. S44760]|nr:hypothetical protein [Bachmanniomyces sp. S44760]
MHFSTALTSTLLLAGTTFAQYGGGGYGDGYGSGSGSGNSYSSAAASPTTDWGTMVSSTAAAPTSSTTVHVVKVSDKGGDLKFIPDVIQANPGDMVQYQFYPKNHSVVESTFANPCVPINNIQPNVTGFFSGFMPVAADAAMMPTFTIPITDTKPHWFYCSQAKHCQAGMVGVINPPANSPKNIDAFTQLAAQAPESLSPGEVSTGSSSSSSSTSSGSGNSTSSTGSGSGSGSGSGTGTGSTPAQAPGSASSGTSSSAAGSASPSASSFSSSDATALSAMSRKGFTGLAVALFAITFVFGVL